MTDTFINNTQIGIFNPGRLADKEIERAFITRIGVFKYLFNKVIGEEKNSIPQHYIVIGQRGMGKSTLLHRIAVELRKPPYNQTFIPLTYPEEQYNVDRLSKFWLNSLDALGDALDKEGNVKELAELDSDVLAWANNAKQITASEMYQHFEDWCQRIGRRAVLLVDNLNLIFDRISKEEQHELRAIMMENNAPILLGASTTTIEDTIQYGAPFYDAFQMTYLKKLTFEETLDILRNLAKITNNQRFLNSFMAYKGRLHALYTLTGGTPRTLVMLYPMIQDGFSIDVQNDLEGLMDVATPLYKARFEELPPQMQVIVDAVALYWDPIHLKDLRTTTHLENAQLAPQLKRLVDSGWLQKQDAYQEKGNAYEISERFFNIWYLMRRSSRRQKKELLCLTKFLVTLYGEELPQLGYAALGKKSKNADYVSLNLALADGIKDKELSEKIRDKSYNELWEMSRNNKRLLSDFVIPDSFFNKKEEELFDESIQLYDKREFLTSLEKLKEVLEINPGNTLAWYNVGFIYLNYLNNFNNAEEAFRKSIEADGNDPANRTALGSLLQMHTSRYTEAEEIYREAIKIDKNYMFAWYNLGTLLMNHTNRYSEAETYFKKAIEKGGGNADSYNAIGILYQDHLHNYQNAALSFKKAIEIDDNYALAKLNLIFLYRDKMNRIEEAKLIFKELSIDPIVADSYYLNKALFAYYDKNVGLANRAFVKALEHIQMEFPVITQDDWWRFAAVVIKLGYADEVLFTMKENNFDIILIPYYEAIQSALKKDSEAYLISKAVEVREAAALILERIKKYQ